MIAQIADPAGSQPERVVKFRQNRLVIVISAAYSRV
jgi:hypothetical protein